MHPPRRADHRFVLGWRCGASGAIAFHKSGCRFAERRDPIIGQLRSRPLIVCLDAQAIAAGRCESSWWRRGTGRALQKP